MLLRFSLLLIFVFLVTVMSDSATSTYFPFRDHHNRGNNCIDGPSYLYSGTTDTTATGIPCQRWDTKVPHVPKYLPSDGGRHNFCRNPDHDLKGVWCYTSSPVVRWAYCNVSKCADDSRLFWADESNSSVSILAVEADPEKINGRTSRKGQFNISVVVDASRVASKYTDVTGSYKRDTIIFVNAKANYIEVNNLASNKSSTHFHGIANTITGITYDWQSENLYWTDSMMNWVMVADRTLSFFTPVYRTGRDEVPTAITVHSALSLLFVSTYKSMGSKVMSTDTAGKDTKILFTFPTILQVTSLSIDYTDDRLYIADFRERGSMVMSCDLDGTNIKRHYFRRGSKFTGIAAYMEYIYIADDNGRYDKRGDMYYSVWLRSKVSRKTLRYNFDGIPRGMKILSRNEESSLDGGAASGAVQNACNAMTPCAHICLPRTSTTKECACAIGYQRVDETKCATTNFEDNYLLAVDEALNKLFQFSLNFDTPTQYSIVNINTNIDLKISKIVPDPARGVIYLLDTEHSKIFKYSLSSSILTTFIESIRVSSAAVDTVTGDLFLVGNDKQSIYIAKQEGGRLQVVTASTSVGVSRSEINMLAVDSKSKKLYFTDTKMSQGHGEIWRMGFDGSSKELIQDNLHWPHAITIDHKRGSLFVGEAKLMSVLEISLGSLGGNTILNDVNVKVHNLNDNLKYQQDQPRPYLSDIQIYFDKLYFFNPHQVKRLDLVTDRLDDFAPRDFYRLSSLALYSNTFNSSPKTDTSYNLCRDHKGPCIPTF